jgi:hypothetical protein
MYNMLDYFFGPAILAAIGLIFMGVGAIPKIRSAGKNPLQDQVEEKPKNETAKFEPTLKGLIIWLEDVSITERLHNQLIFGGVVLLLFGGCWALALATQRPSAVIAESVGPTQTAVAQTQTAFLQSPTPSIASSIQSTYSPLPTLLGVSLISAQYASSEWEPRSIDLTTSGTRGIKADANSSLRLFNLWVSVPPKLSGYRGKLQVFAGDKLIGESSTLDLVPGGTNFAEITPTGFQDPVVANAWKKQSDWDMLYINLVVTGNNNFSSETYIASLRLNREDTSWYLTPPYATISAVVYRVNGGPQKLLNLQASQGKCLDARPGDALSIDQIWYRTPNDSSSQTLRARVFFVNDQTGAHEDAMSRNSAPAAFTTGVSELLNGNFLTWEKIPEDHILIALMRGKEETILDRIDCHTTTTPTGLDWRNGVLTFVRFNSVLDQSELDPGFLWEPGENKSNGYHLENSVLSITSGPWTNQVSSQSSAPLVAYPLKGDFDAQVKLTLKPVNGVYAGIGLRSPQDHTTWIRIARTLDGSGDGLAFSQNTQGTFGGYEWLAYTNDVIFLKVGRHGNDLVFLYSADGTNWTPQKQVTMSLPEKVEVYFFILSQTPDNATAQFESFILGKIP